MKPSRKVRGECFRCGQVKNLLWRQTLDRGECRACTARRAPRENCSGCGRERRINARTADGGALCGTCYARNRTGTDRCEGCKVVGPLVARADGRSQTARDLCQRCYRSPRRPCGICGRVKKVALKATATSPDVCPTCYQAPVIDCSICGQQALGRRTTNRGRPRCFACQVKQQIDAALTGPDGQIRAELKPVRDAMTEVRSPRSLLSNWHRLPSLSLLRDIAQGRIDLSHAALDARSQTFSVTYLRSILVAAGALPPRDENASRLHRYANESACDIADPNLRGVFTRYARWHVVDRAKTNRHGRISSDTAKRCQGDIRTAKNFLKHLAAHGRTLDDCSQACVDAWLTTDRSPGLGFIRWLSRNGYLPGCRLPDPVRQKDPSHDVDPNTQIDLARQLLHDPDSASLEDRSAALLILLYAQPAAKIVTLTTNDILTRDSDTYLLLGREPLLLIPPLDGLVAALPADKPFGTASSLADHRWLFTGKNAGTHLHSASLMRRMNRLGITTRASRNAALLHLAINHTTSCVRQPHRHSRQHCHPLGRTRRLPLEHLRRRRLITGRPI